VLDSVNPDESAADRKNRRLELLEKSMNEFEQEVYLNKPFYPETIHELLLQLRVEAHMEGIQFAQTSPYPRDPNYLENYWNNADENCKKINALTDKLCDAIRHNLHGRRLWERR
jgi:hypothetical protein